jgi:hypothetical protein
MGFPEASKGSRCETKIIGGENRGVLTSRGGVGCYRTIPRRPCSPALPGRSAASLADSNALGDLPPKGLSLGLCSTATRRCQRQNGNTPKTGAPRGSRFPFEPLYSASCTALFLGFIGAPSYFLDGQFPDLAPLRVAAAQTPRHREIQGKTSGRLHPNSPR